MIKVMKLLLTFFIFIFLQTTYLSAQVINKVIISGNERISVETIKVFTNFKNGQELSETQLNEILKNLYETNFFENVKVEIDNYNLLITVKENRIIQEVIINGVKNKTLNKAIYESLILKNKNSYVKYLAQKDILTIKNSLRVSGYYLSNVKSLIKENNNNTINLIYQIDLGEKALIKKIKFIGDKKFKDRKLRQIIVSEENKFWKFLSNKKFLDAKRTILDERLLKNFYKSKGYYEVKIESSNAKFVNNKYFELIYNINAGEKFIFNNLNITLPNDYKLEHFEGVSSVLKKLENTTYSLNKIDKILKEIDKIALSKQYEFINATVEESIIDDNKLNINFIINETEKFYVEKINLFGNNITRENVIRNAFIVDEGDAFNKILFNKSLNVLRSKNIFKSVNSKIIEGSEANLKILEITIEEKATGEISAGAGVGTSGGQIGVGIKENNYLGKGIKLNTDLTVSSESITGKFSINNPNFNNSDHSLFTEISSQETDKLADFGYKSTKSSLSFGSNFEKYENLYFFPSFHIDYENLKTTDQASTALKKQEGTYFDTSIMYRLNYDVRNSPYQATNGYRSVFAQEIPITSDTYELMNSYEFTKYHQYFNDKMASFSFHAKSINSLAGEDVRISKRLYVPGRKLRGFEKGMVGPIENNDYVGGNYLSTINFSTTLPNFLPDQQNTDFKFFIDVANLWGVDYSDPLDDNGTIRSSTGIAVDWFTPIGPLSFSLSQPLTKKSTDKTETFRFNLGTTF